MRSRHQGGEGKRQAHRQEECSTADSRPWSGTAEVLAITDLAGKAFQSQMKLRTTGRHNKFFQGARRSHN